MSERKTHWENVYQQKSPVEVSWYQAIPEVSLALIERCQLPKDASVIDVGGGASLLVDSLLEQGFTSLTVLDISAAALAHSQQRLGDLAEKVSWRTADITAVDFGVKFDLWHDRAVFHFLTAAADRQAYIENLKQALKPGGFLILSAFDIGGPEKCSGLEIVQYDAEKLQAVLGADFNLLEERREQHHTPAGREQAFHYFRFQYQPK
ncbi:class I SAM-dependent methyltransferase [Spongiibacter sp. KMU-158]|uniref:Class I SAM-dependent methyltransferase n=1 Tax=Spongiibacter pelagi TaxID=2760804 RepID=A0A927GV12_9GAMM|nr:class I SAM-dependent methyltransferase [Spongiibacter pelagi]MBD2857402.1 class I SAM-dependent methyltransferase [Spongiibacter pelagi]